MYREKIETYNFMSDPEVPRGDYDFPGNFLSFCIFVVSFSNAI